MNPCRKRSKKPKYPLAFVLPNGSSLKYSFPYERGNQFKWFRDQLTDGLLKWNPKNKTGRVKLGLWSSRSNQCVIAADFDRLNEDFESFDHLYELLRALFGVSNDGIVTRSVSGKCKVFFVVQLNSDFPTKMTLGLARQALRKILSETLYPLVDDSAGALSLCFINASLLADLREGLYNNPKIFEFSLSDTLKRDEDTVTSSTLTYDSKPLRAHLGPIPDFTKFFIGNGPYSKKREHFIRVILSCPGLIGRGFGLSTIKFAETVKVEQQTVSKWREEIERLGWIERVSNAYVPGKRAITYLACGPLAETLVEFAPRKGTKRSPSVLPSFIPDGHWDEALWRASAAFNCDEESFLKWVRTIPGHGEKDRIEKAIHKIEQRQKLRS